MLERKGWMNFRTSYLKRITQLLVCAFLISFNPISIAEPLKITGPDGQSRQQNRQYGPTTKSDTFWSIAVKMRPNNKVSIYQVMAAIYDANPHAFANSNYNSLEAGMILLVPPAEKMLAIPLNIAKERAEQDDKNWKKQRTQPKKQVTKPKAKPQSKTIEQKIAEVKTESESPQKINQLTLLLEEEENKVISLTDELSRTQDELTIAKDDLQALKTKLAELSDKVDVLESTLIETRQLNATLKAENKVLQDTLALEQEEQPTDIWRSLLDSPLMLMALAIVPALLLILLIFLVWRRKQSSNEESFTESNKPEPEPVAETVEEIQPQEIDLEPAVEEDNVDEIFEEMAVQLDDVEPEPESGLDDLVAPEEIEEQGAEADLDDLWAEALDEQIDGKEISADVEELLNKLDESTDEASDEVSVDDNLDELIESVELDAPLNEEPLQEPTEESVDDVSEFFEESVSELSAAELESIDDIEELISETQDSSDDVEEMAFDHQQPEMEDNEASTEENSAIDSEDDSLEYEALSTDDASGVDLEDSNIDVSVEDDTEPVEVINDDGLDFELESLDIEPEVNEETAEIDFDAVDDDGLDFISENINDVSELSSEDNIDTASTESTDLSEPAVDDGLDFEPVALDEAPEADIEPENTEVTSEELIEPSLENVQEENELSDIPAEPLIDSMVESDSNISPTAEVEELNESELPAPDADSFVEESDEVALSVDTELESEPEPEPEVVPAEPIDDLDALMAEFDVDVPNQTQSSTLPDPELDSFTTDFPESDIDSLGVDMSAAEQVETGTIESSVDSEFMPDEQQPVDDVVESPIIDNSAPTELADDSSAMPDLDFKVDLSDDELFDSFAKVSDEMKHTEALLVNDMDIDDLETDDASDEPSFEGDSMTVDEALAALDNEIDTDIKAEKISDDDLSNFQKENGYIDIDKLLNESSEESTDVDPYKEVDVNLGESSDLNSLFESNPMIDVDDAENSVNAKLDLARAYIEIDDKDSAKALLEEIQVDGNDRQKSEATELLTSIG